MSQNNEEVARLIAETIKQALATAQLSTKKVSAKVPDSYDGSRKAATLDNWLFAMENYRDAEDLGDVETIKLAITLLAGEAATWWRHYRASRECPSEWVEFKAALITEFQPGKARDLAWERFSSLRQTESVTDYATQFRAVIL